MHRPLLSSVCCGAPSGCNHQDSERSRAGRHYHLHLYLYYTITLRLVTPHGVYICPRGGASKDVLQVTLPDSVTRIILILWQCPVNANTTLSEESFFRLMRLFLRLPSSQSAKVLSALESYPSHLFASRLLKPLQEHLSLQMLTGNNATLYHHFLSSFFFIYLFLLSMRIVDTSYKVRFCHNVKANFLH